MYRYFFYPEIKPFLTDEKIQELFPKKVNVSDLINKRSKGENETYICELIRNDSIVDFISHVTSKSLDLSRTTIRPSFYETNPLLNEKVATLIEYATFFGSIQIFKYLQMNGVELTPSLWIYAIHGRNAELINLLNETNVPPPEGSFEKCLIEAIKCHHNEIAYYIDENLFSISDSNHYSDELLMAIYRYYNYSYFPENLDEKSSFFYLSQFNHLKIVDFIIQTKKDEFEEKIISNHFCFK